LDRWKEEKDVVVNKEGALGYTYSEPIGHTVKLMPTRKTFSLSIAYKLTPARPIEEEVMTERPQGQLPGEEPKKLRGTEQIVVPTLTH